MINRLKTKALNLTAKGAIVEISDNESGSSIWNEITDADLKSRVFLSVELRQHLKSSLESVDERVFLFPDKPSYKRVVITSASDLKKINLPQIAFGWISCDSLQQCYDVLKTLLRRIQVNGLVCLQPPSTASSKDSDLDLSQLKDFSYTYEGNVIILERIKDAAPGKQQKRADKVLKGLIDPKLINYFQDTVELDPWSIRWRYLRPYKSDIFRIDKRSKQSYEIGLASYEEATLLYNLAMLFSGRRGLEIGTHYGWTGAHLLKAGLLMDFIDPGFHDKSQYDAVDHVFRKISQSRYLLHTGKSPELVTTLCRLTKVKWSFVFIDGDHHGLAPSKDALAVNESCAEDAMIVFHDLAVPGVLQGLRVLEHSGWNTGWVDTMQGLGIAWRGEISKNFPNDFSVISF